jgi:UDP-GlcNAc:undecaprenyl-phosphate GlcNAc-1-phosphate transferase
LAAGSPVSASYQALLIVSGLGAIATGACVWSALVALRRAQILDVPGERSSHTTPTVRGLGIGLAGGAMLTMVVAGGRGELTVGQWGMVIAPLAFALLGLADDLRGGLSPKARLAAQVLLATAAAGLVGTAFDGGLAWTLIAAMALVVFVNAFNFMDGINGISGTTALVAGASYAAMGVMLDDVGILVVGSSIAGAALGFLPFNFPNARGFLGDSGSYFLGSALALLAAAAWGAGASIIAAVLPLSLYLADTGWTLIRRARAGESLMTAHRSHAYQRLARAWASHSQATGLTTSITLVLAVMAVIVCQGTATINSVAAAAGVIILAVYLRLPALQDRQATTPTRNA